MCKQCWTRLHMSSHNAQHGSYSSSKATLYKMKLGNKHSSTQTSFVDSEWVCSISSLNTLIKLSGMCQKHCTIIFWCFVFIQLYNMQIESELREKFNGKANSPENQDLNLVESVAGYSHSFSVTSYDATFVLALALNNTYEGKKK